MEEKAARLASLRDRIQEGILAIPGTYLNGDEENRLPGILNVSFEKIDGEALLFELDLKGIRGFFRFGVYFRIRGSESCPAGCRGTVSAGTRLSADFTRTL